MGDFEAFHVINSLMVLWLVVCFCQLKNNVKFQVTVSSQLKFRTYKNYVNKTNQSGYTYFLNFSSVLSVKVC